jgi:hypothetical protein
MAAKVMNLYQDQLMVVSSQPEPPSCSQYVEITDYDKDTSAQ